MVREKKGGERIPTGMRSLYIVEILAQSGRPMTPTEINEVLGLPKPTIHRLCQTLESEGVLEKDLDGKRFLPGPRLRSISAGVTAFANFSQARRAVLEHLSTLIGETCNIVVPGEGGMTYLERVETRWPLRVQFPIGERVPYHCTASGKLYLSSLRKSQRTHLVNSLSLEKHAANTITDSADLLDVLEKTRKQGFGTDNEEFVKGMVAVSVPINNASGKMMAALAMHAPTQRMSMKEALAQTKEMQKAAIRIRATFGVDVN